MTRRRGLLALLVAIPLVVGCEGELGRSSTETSFQTTMTLTAEHPVVTRSFDVVARAGEQPVLGVQAGVDVVGVDGAQHPDVWISVLNLETGDSGYDPEGTNGASIAGGGRTPCDGKPSLADGQERGDPTPPCESRWTVIARWLEPEPGAEIPLQLDARMRAYAHHLYGDDDPFTLEAFAVTDGGVPLPVDGPAVTRTSTRGSARVTPISGVETHDFVLKIPAALLEQRGDDLHLGRIFLGIDRTEWSGSPMTMRTELRIDDEIIASSTAPTSMERDWLARCEPGSDCELPITLTFEPVSASTVASLPPDGVMAVDWVLETRFEDFGEGATLPADLTLEIIEP